MSFLNLMTNRIVVARLSAISGDKTAYATLTVEYGSIQRMSDEKAIGIGQAIGKIFRLYTEENADIQKGDSIRDDEENEYKVISVSIPAELGSFIHKECTLLKTK